MKARNREINIITMSALDMFCSALGAFMFLSILTMVFAPNLGPSTAEVRQMQKENKEMKKALKSEETDVAIVMDTTGSMVDYLDNLKKQIGTFAAIVNRLSGHTRIAIVDYKDRCLGSQAVKALPLTHVDDAGMRQIQGFVDRMAIKRDCNNDPPEAVAAAVSRATSEASDGLGWHAETKNRYIVVIGDNPPYDDERERPEADAKRWAAAGSRLSTFFTKGTPEAEQYYRDLASAGNGKFINDASGSFALYLLQAMSE